MNQTRLAGFGGLAFGILAFGAMMIASPPGGNYKVSDVTSFLAKGHRPAVFLSMYVMVIAVIGLVLLLARLRTAIEGPRQSLFWGLSIASAASWLTGYAIVVAAPAALAFSGGKLTATAIAPQTGYLFSESRVRGDVRRRRDSARSGVGDVRRWACRGGPVGAVGDGGRRDRSARRDRLVPDVPGLPVVDRFRSLDACRCTGRTATIRECADITACREGRRKHAAPPNRPATGATRCTPPLRFGVAQSS